MKLFVKGVDFTWDAARLREALLPLGLREVEWFPVDRDNPKRNRGIAVVTFDDTTARSLLGTSRRFGARTLTFSENRERAPGGTERPPTTKAPVVKQPDSPRAGEGPTVVPPYRFVPAILRHAVSDALVLHDGSAPRDALSGELRVTLTALTPLLVGCDLYEQPLPDGKKKKVLEPLRLADGRVVIAGASIKGMLRHALGALLAAPMERVAERTWSYRPHLAPTLGVRRTPRAAVVVASPDKLGDGLIVALLPPLRYDRNDPVANKIRFLRTHDPVPPGMTEHRYVGGVDGDGTLAAKFGRGGRVYQRVAVANTLPRDRAPIERALVEHYWRTLEHIADTAGGHLSERHPLLDRTEAEALARRVAALKGQTLHVGDVIYCEWDEVLRRVLSFGHNFRYRWRHTDSVRVHDGAPRAIVSPLSTERASEAAPQPTQLSAVRGVMGYTGDNEGSAGVGEGPFAHLAGRVAVNMAIEHPVKPEPGDRFCGTAPRYEVALRILGAPKAGAAEFYLQQGDPAERGDPGAMRTYGDVAGVDVPGELAGRKFYLHQPGAATDASFYETSDPAVVQGDQASLARYVSRPGTSFRFTLRFRDLRPWELGALMLCLAPTPARVAAVAGDVLEVRSWLDGVERDAKASSGPAMASKLGHGRPLGMGSVASTIDGCDVFDRGALTDASAAQETWLRALQMKLDEHDRRGWAQEVLLPWLRVHRYAGRHRAEYPRARDNRGDETIYNWHTEARREHARQRQGQTPREATRARRPTPLDE